MIENIYHLGQILIHLGAVTHNQVIEARKHQMKFEGKKKIGKILLEFGYITEEDLYRGLSLQRDLKSILSPA